MWISSTRIRIVSILTHHFPSASTAAMSAAKKGISTICIIILVIFKAIVGNISVINLSSSSWFLSLIFFFKLQTGEFGTHVKAWW